MTQVRKDPHLRSLNVKDKNLFLNVHLSGAASFGAAFK